MRAVTKYLLWLLVTILPLCFSEVLASDLDDGISKYTDDPVSKSDELGDKIVNKHYIVMKAKSMANAAKDRDDCYELDKYSNVQNSVVVGNGANARNLKTIINVQDKNGRSNPIGCVK